MDSTAPAARPSPVPGARLRALLFHPLAFPILLILATLFARRDALSTPISQVRPTLTAMITRNLGRDLEELGLRAIFYPRVDFGGDQPGYLLQEFPVMNLAGVALRGLGLSLEVAYRLPSLLCFVVMLALLHAFVRARFGTVEAVAATLLVSAFSIAVAHSIEVMPEQGVLTAFLAGLYFFERHLVNGRRRTLVAAAAGFGLMLLTKPTSGFLFLAPLGLYWSQRGTLRGLFPRYALMAVASALPLLVWLVHVWRVNEASIMDDGRTAEVLAIDNYLNQHDRWNLLATGETYTRFVGQLSDAYGSWALLLLVAGSALVLSRRGRNRALLGCWLVALLLYFLVLPFNTTTHAYYTHPYAPLIAVGAASAVGWLVNAATRLVPAAGHPSVRAVLALAALAGTLLAHWNYAPPFNREKREFGRALHDVTRSRALGIISSEEKGVWNGELFYVSDTRGWRASVRPGPSWRPISEEYVEEKRRRGAEFLAHYGPPEDLAAKLPGLVERLTARDAVLATAPGWVVYSLKE